MDRMSADLLSALTTRGESGCRLNPDRLLSKLTPAQAGVLRRKYAIGLDHACEPAEIGRQMGMSVAEVEATEAEALRRLADV